MNKQKIIALAIGVSMVSSTILPGVIANANPRKQTTQKIQSKDKTNKNINEGKTKLDATSNVYNVTSQSEFDTALHQVFLHGGTINLETNVQLNQKMVFENGGIINGNNHTILIDNNNGPVNFYMYNRAVTVNNLNIKAGALSYGIVFVTNEYSTLIINGSLNIQAQYAPVSINGNYNDTNISGRVILENATTVSSNQNFRYGNATVLLNGRIIHELQNEINTAKAMKIDGYTPDSVTTLQNAITAAEGVMNINNSPDANNQDMEIATINLQNAIKGLAVNTEGLQNEINTAKAMNTDGYTSDSVKVLQGAITVAQGVVNNKDATIQDVTTAMTNLQNAIKGLVVNIEGLQNEINRAKAMNTDGYTSDSVKALQGAITVAQAVVSNKDASVQDVNTAMTNLQNAIKGLVVNTEGLQTEINTAKGMNTNGYTPDSVKTLQSAITAAQAVVSNKDASVQDVNTATTNLQNAVKGLAVNTEALQNEINTAKGMNTNGYTPDSVKTLQSAITVAQAVVNNKDASVQDVNTAMTNLQNAVKGLVKESINVESNVENAYFEPYGLVINANLDGMNFAQNSVKDLIVENSNGQKVTIKGVNVNWYSKDLTNFSGAQFIITPSMLNKLGNELSAKLYVTYMNNGIIKKVPLETNKDLNGASFDIPFNLINNDKQAMLKGVNDTITNTSSIKIQYTKPYGLVINTDNNFENKTLNKSDKIQLMVKNSNGDIVNTFDGVNVNWYSFGNYSGAQFIISNKSLNELKIIKKMQGGLSFAISYDNMINSLNLNINEMGPTIGISNF
ncbi:MAG: hypothetical protein ACRC41_10775 [Sarcina sp.]